MPSPAPFTPPSPAHILRLRGALAVSLALAALLVLASVAAPPRALADPKYDADGTLLAPAEGMKAAGFTPDRASTASAERGNADPNGSVFRVAPSEFFMMGGTKAPGGADSMGTFQIPSLDAALIPSNALTSTPLEGVENVWNDDEARKRMVRNPGAVAPIDINGDGIDEIAQVYYACDRDTGANASLHYTVFDEYGKVYLDGTFFEYETPTPGSDVYNNYPSQSWSSIFKLCVGDFDGDGNEDLCFMKTTQETTSYVYAVCEIMLLDYDEERDACDTRWIECGFLNEYADETAHVYQPCTLSASDIDGDGRDEVLYTFMNTLANTCEVGTISVDPNESGQFAAHKQPCAVTGVPLDGASMLSASPGDIDADGQDEVVLGGYSHGELFLGYLEYDRESGALMPDVRGLTRLYDDDNTHYTTGAGLSDHHHADTSQYWTDKDSDYIPPGGRSLATYVNATNWTVPLQTASLSGAGSTGSAPHARDQVFFGMIFYEFDDERGSFEIFEDMTAAYQYNDDNNVSVLSMQPVVVDDMVDARDVDALASYTGKEALLVTVSRDRDKDHGKDLAYEAYLYSPQTLSDPNVSPDIPLVSYTRFEMAQSGYDDRTLYPKACALNCDDDAIYLKLREHQFTYSEPILTGVIMAPPYFSDLKSLTGYDSGSTAYTVTDNTTTEKGGSSSLEFGGSFKVGVKKLKVGPTLAGSYEGAWTHTTTKEYWYTLGTSGGQDSAALHCIPADVYLYDTYTYDMETRTFAKGEPLTMTFPCEPVTQIVPLDDPDVLKENDYAAISQRYNDWARAQNEGRASGDCYRLLPEMDEFLNHVAGDPTSYTERVDGLVGEVFEGNSRLAVDHSLGFGNTYQSTTVIYSEGDSAQYGGYFNAGVELSREGWLSDGAVDVSVSDGGFKGKTTTDGSIFEGVVNSIASDYEDYDYSALMYAGTKLPADSTAKDPEDDDRAYVIIDYTTSDVRCPPALARNVRAEAAGAYAMKVTCTLPWDVPVSWRAQRYQLECYDEAARSWKVVEGAVADDPQTNASQEWSFTHEGLDPAKCYWYRMASLREGGGELARNEVAFSGTTADAPRWEVTYESPEHAHMWAYRVDEYGSCFSIVSGAEVTDRSTVRFACIPEPGYEVSAWSVLDGNGAALPPAGYQADGGLLVIESLASSVQVAPRVEAVAVPPAVLEGEGPGEGEGASFAAMAEPSSDAGLGVQVSYPHDGVWTTDGGASILIKFLEGTRVGSFAYMHRSLHAGDVEGEAQPSDLLVDNLENGKFTFPLVLNGRDGATQQVRELSVLKDAGLIKLDPQLLEGYDATTHEKSATILFGAYPGASGLKAFEIAPGADAEGGWQDASGHFAAGFMPMESGTWTLRLTNVAGESVSRTVEVPAYPKAGRPDPVVPDKPEAPDGEGPGAVPPSRPVGGAGDGLPLAPTGDASAPLAGAAAMAGLAALASLAVAGRLAKRRR